MPGGDYVNALDDDNPFNDPIKYWPFKGGAFPPKDYIGPDDARELGALAQSSRTFAAASFASRTASCTAA